MKKRILCLGLALLIVLLLAGCGGLFRPEPTPEPTPVPTPTPTPVPTPVPLNAPIPLEQMPELTDNNTFTWASGSIELQATDRKIGSIYLIWDKLPGQWSMTVDGELVTVGTNGFLHEFITLDAPAENVVIQAPVGLCEVYTFEPDAQIPDWVQRWQPAWEHADLLLLSTHSDDEHLFFGGMMPYYSQERGLKVQVAYLTHHWDQPPRPHELLDGLWEVGIRAYPVIGPFDDLYSRSWENALERFNWDDIVAYQVELLRRFKPSVVATHDINGEYGHGAHMLSGRGMAEAVTLAADPSYDPRTAEFYGTWDTPKLYLHLYPENQITLDWYKPMEAFGGRNGIEVATDGYAKHVSQHIYAFYVYGEGDDYDSRKFGLYRSTVGPDLVGGDIFENITTYY